MGESIRSGRSAFERFRPAIIRVSKTLALTPTWFRVWLWHRVEGWHGTVGAGARYCILRTMIAECGDNVFIGPYVEIRGWTKIALGSNVSIHRNCYVDGTGGILIGSNVSIAHATTIMSSDHSYADKERPIKYNPTIESPVSIEDDVWVGCGCRILAGVKIGKRTVVAAGAVVTRSVAGGVIVGGVPAREIKQLESASKLE